MSAAVQMSGDQAAEVRRLIRYHRNDHMIANYVGVPVDAVKRMRAKYARKGHQGAWLKPGVSPFTGNDSEVKRKTTDGSNRLLCAMLAYGAARGGLPGLSDQRFHQLCNEQGITTSTGASL